MLGMRSGFVMWLVECKSFYVFLKGLGVTSCSGEVKYIRH